jgi:hypothetical protein
MRGGKKKRGKQAEKSPCLQHAAAFQNAETKALYCSVAFTTLLRRLRGLRLDAAPEDVQWRANMILRGLQRLPVAF